MVVVFEQSCVACRWLPGAGDGAPRRRTARWSSSTSDRSGEPRVEQRSPPGHRAVGHRCTVRLPWHGDHMPGIPAVVGAIAEAQPSGRPLLLVDLHSNRPDQRGILTGSASLRRCPRNPPSRRSRQRAGRWPARGRSCRRGRTLHVQRGLSAHDELRDRPEGHFTWRQGQAARDPETTMNASLRLRRAIGRHSPFRVLPCRNVNVALEAPPPAAGPADRPPAGRIPPGRTLVEERISPLSRTRQPRHTMNRLARSWQRLAGHERSCYRIGPSGFASCVVGTRFTLRASDVACRESQAKSD